MNFFFIMFWGASISHLNYLLSMDYGPTVQRMHKNSKADRFEKKELSACCCCKKCFLASMLFLEFGCTKCMVPLLNKSCKCLNSICEHMPACPSWFHYSDEEEFKRLCLSVSGGLAAASLISRALLWCIESYEEQEKL